MNDSRGTRSLVWSGPLFAVLFLIIGVFLSGDRPAEKASAEKVVSFYRDHQGTVLTSVFLAPLGAALLVLFASYLRNRARASGGSGIGPDVMFGGAVLWAAGLLLGSMLDLAVATASDHKQPQIAQTFNVLVNEDWVPFIGGLAVFLIGAGMTVLSSRVLPSWLGWVAVVVGIVALAGPGGFLGFFLAPLWILVAGIMLGLRSDHHASD